MPENPVGETRVKVKDNQSEYNIARINECDQDIIHMYWMIKLPNEAVRVHRWIINFYKRTFKAIKCAST